MKDSWPVLSAKPYHLHSTMNHLTRHQELALVVDRHNHGMIVVRHVGNVAFADSKVDLAPRDLRVAIRTEIGSALAHRRPATLLEVTMA